MIKTISGFPNYSITVTGKVWNNKRKKWLKSTKRQHDYLTVDLGKGNRQYIHRLMLDTFVADCPDGMQCRHLDGDRGNNDLSNIKWGTPKDNGEDKVRHGTTTKGICFNKGEKHGRAKLTEQEVRMIIYIYRTGLFTQQEVADMYNVTDMTISRIINKKLWKYVWKE